MSTSALDKAFVAAVRAAQRSKRTLGRHDEIYDIATEVWDGVFRVEHHSGQAKAAIGSEVEHDYPGRTIKGTWKVKLHSSTGSVR